MSLYERIEQRERENGQILALVLGHISFMMAAAVMSYFCSPGLGLLVLGVAFYCSRTLGALLEADKEVSLALIAEMEADIGEIEKALLEFEAEEEARKRERR